MKGTLMLLVVMMGLAWVGPMQAQDRCSVIPSSYWPTNGTPTSSTANAALNWVEWARNMGIKVNRPKNFDGGYAYNSGGPVTNSSLCWGGPTSKPTTLWDYDEEGSNTTYCHTEGDAGYPNCFSSPLMYTSVNWAYRSSLYDIKGTTPYQTCDTGNYYKWTTSKKKSTYQFPLFARKQNPTSSDILYPDFTYTSSARFRVGSPTSTTYFVPSSTNKFWVIAYCNAGCYSPEQLVLFSDGYQDIESAEEEQRSDLVTLKPGSDMESLELQVNEVGSYMKEVVPDSKHLLRELTMESGGKLRVTMNHPVVKYVDGSGHIVEAIRLNVGDSLVKVDGTPDRIASIANVSFTGRVYNVRPKTLDAISNIVVAEGYLQGSSAYQTKDLGYTNRMIHAGVIPPGVIP